MIVYTSWGKEPLSFSISFCLLILVEYTWGILWVSNLLIKLVLTFDSLSDQHGLPKTHYKGPETKQTIKQNGTKSVPATLTEVHGLAVLFSTPNRWENTWGKPGCFRLFGFLALVYITCSSQDAPLLPSLISFTPTDWAFSCSYSLISVGQSAQKRMCSNCLFTTTPPCPFTTAITAVRTRPPFSTLSSGTYINQPQMFMLEERERERKWETEGSRSILTQ